jgi:(1->4)-alpha-D-glucan 1-alpha-D-glucosylmutase
VRSRIDVLSEMPKDWRTAVRRWARMNRKYKHNVDGQPAPSPNEEYFLYQTILGVWPFERDLSDAQHAEIVARLKAYMRKAMNEAKVNTSWINPNEPYQEAVAAFIEAILRRDDANRFLPDMLAFQQRIAHYGVFNSLSQVLLKLTAPGVPDIYQGNEIWDFSLVDPDNRRPVDYGLRTRLLNRVEKIRDAKAAARLVEAPEDGRIKLLVTARTLNFRRDNPDLFAGGSYVPLSVEGKFSENVLAYARSYEGSTAVVVAPMLVSRLGKPGELIVPRGAVWAGTRLMLPETEVGTKFRNVFTGEIIEATEQGGGIGLALDDALRVFPLALLQRV